MGWAIGVGIDASKVDAVFSHRATTLFVLLPVFVVIANSALVAVALRTNLTVKRGSLLLPVAGWHWRLEVVLYGGVRDNQLWSSLPRFQIVRATRAFLKSRRGDVARWYLRMRETSSNNGLGLRLRP